MAIKPLKTLCRLLQAISNLPRIEPSQRLRGYYYGQLLANCGKNFRVGVGARIRNPALVSVGSNCYLGEDAHLYPWNEKIVIGNNVLIAAGAKIISRNHAFEKLGLPISSSGYNNQPIIIDDDVWIGFNVVILAGVTIGRGSIIGANAVVTKNIEPYSIMGGVPARLIRKRNE